MHLGVGRLRFTGSAGALARNEREAGTRAGLDFPNWLRRGRGRPRSQ